MATTEMTHLHPAARALAGLEETQRVQALQRDRWIDYPRATEALQRLERLLQTRSENACPAL